MITEDIIDWVATLPKLDSLSEELYEDSEDEE